MASSEKKRAREHNAAARRDRAVQKRLDKTAVRNGVDGAFQNSYEGTPTQDESAATPPDGVRSEEAQSADAQSPDRQEPRTGTGAVS